MLIQLSQHLSPNLASKLQPLIAATDVNIFKNWCLGEESEDSEETGKCELINMVTCCNILMFNYFVQQSPTVICNI